MSDSSVDRFSTHEVFNQAPPLIDYNLLTSNRALVEALKREAHGHGFDSVREFGAVMGRAETLALGVAANRNPPVLCAFDAQGYRRDEVAFHPAWHRLMEIVVGHGLHAGPWRDRAPGAHVVRAARAIIHAQVDAGTQCPTTMTYGSIPVLRREGALAPVWMPKLLSLHYDSTFQPVDRKSGALVGMGMTEKQGGSDVRSNTTRAEPVAAGNGAYRLVGHKWFFSAPMCDAFLVLAQAPKGLSCFFLPRFTPDGARNAIRLQRLKDKLGNRSNASSEVEFAGACGWLVGEEGRGIPTILEMGNYTRLDCALGSAGMMRLAVAQAIHHAGHRVAFQRKLADQPLMENVLADLAIESEAATMLVMRLARAFDEQEDEREEVLRRVLTPAVKYWVCKRGPMVAAEAMEVLGGNGYVEDSPMPRIYREMPLNSIWEGSGNIMCLDVLRALHRNPAFLEILDAEIALVRGDPGFDRFADRLRADLRNGEPQEGAARRLTECLVLAVQASLLLRHAPSAVAEAFIASRLSAAWSGSFGTLSSGAGLRAIIDRARPV